MPLRRQRPGKTLCRRMSYHLTKSMIPMISSKLAILVNIHQRIGIHTVESLLHCVLCSGVDRFDEVSCRRLCNHSSGLITTHGKYLAANADAKDPHPLQDPMSLTAPPSHSHFLTTSSPNQLVHSTLH